MSDPKTEPKKETTRGQKNQMMAQMAETIQLQEANLAEAMAEAKEARKAQVVAEAANEKMRTALAKAVGRIEVMIDMNPETGPADPLLEALRAMLDKASNGK